MEVEITSSLKIYMEVSSEIMLTKFEVLQNVMMGFHEPGDASV